jgi:hypothetical protein
MVADCCCCLYVVYAYGCPLPPIGCCLHARCAETAKSSYKTVPALIKLKGHTEHSLVIGKLLGGEHQDVVTVAPARRSGPSAAAAAEATAGAGSAGTSAAAAGAGSAGTVHVVSKSESGSPTVVPFDVGLHITPVDATRVAKAEASKQAQAVLKGGVKDVQQRFSNAWHPAALLSSPHAILKDGQCVLGSRGAGRPWVCILSGGVRPACGLNSVVCGQWCSGEVVQFLREVSAADGVMLESYCLTAFGTEAVVGADEVELGDPPLIRSCV